MTARKNNGHRAISRKGLILKLDRIFSRFVRMRSAVGGICTCVTCGKQMPWQEIQAGHWVKRGHAAVRYDLRNVYPQCAGCNLFKNGAQDEMAAHILAVHGPQAIEDLIRLKHTTTHLRASEIREMIAGYEAQSCQI